MFLKLLLIADVFSYHCLCLRFASDEVDVKPECIHSGLTLSEYIHNRARALDNAKQHKSSIWIFHITHHAGTSLKGFAEANGWQTTVLPAHLCGLKLEELQDRALYYDSVCGEHGMTGVVNLADSFPCSSDKLFMITSMRNPILRIIAGGGGYPQNPNTDDCGTDNFALRKLIDKPFGEPITRADVELAKARLSAFDIVVDAENMGNTIPALCGMLGWTEKCTGGALDAAETDQIHAAKLVAFQQDHPDLYHKWVKRNAPEMELYEHAKSLSIASGSSSIMESMPMSKSLETFYDTAETAWSCHGNATDGFA